MRIEEFEAELKLLNKDLAVRQNTAPKKVLEAFPDIVKLASITLRGSEICSIPAEEIFDEPNGAFGVDLRNDGRFVRHRTRLEALQIVRDTLDRLEHDKEFYNDFFGLGESSAAALRHKDPEPDMLIEEISVEAKEVQSGTIEAPQ